MAKKPAHPAPVVPSDILLKLSAKCVELRDTELEIENLTERLKELNKTVYAIEHEQLPELMAEAGVDKIGIPAEGNHPAVDLQLKPFYSANIAAGWEPERRKTAFEYLEAEDAGDLIKTQIIIDLPREERDKAKGLIEQLAEYSPSVKEAVHAATLTSWLKEKSEEGEEVELEKIGGTIGTVVKVKARKST